MRSRNSISISLLLMVVVLLSSVGARNFTVPTDEITPTPEVTPDTGETGEAVDSLPVQVDNAPLEIDSNVRSQADSQQTFDFWIEFRQTANLDSVPEKLHKKDRSTLVYKSMTSIADSSQTQVVAYLNEKNLKYDSHWIVNSILVYGATQADLDMLVTFPEVLAIKDRFTVALEDTQAVPIDDSTVVAAATINWGLSFTHAPTVWSTFGDEGEGIVVANIDTGVLYTHAALVNQYRGTVTGSNNYNWYAPTAAAKAACTGASTAPCDWNGHGTHTMGTMVGQDGANQTGMAPKAEWIACMGCDLTATNNCSDNALTTCAEWILAPTDLNGNNADPTKAPDVVNNSWGGGRGNTWYESYVQAWVAAGIFPAFSAGNNGPSCSTAGSPGDYIESFASGAISSNGYIASFSSRGPGSFGNNLKPDLVAPGVSIQSTYKDGGYASMDGTSMASPHTAGAVALLWSAVPQLNGDVATTISLLYSSANPNVPNNNVCGAPGSATVPNYTYGYGYLDALQLVTDGIALFPTYELNLPLVINP